MINSCHYFNKYSPLLVQSQLKSLILQVLHHVGSVVSSFSRAKAPPAKRNDGLWGRSFQIVLGTFLARFGFGSTILIREHFFGQRASSDNFFGKQADF